MRKPKFTRPLTIALPQDHFDLIKQITDEKQISIAHWVRDAVTAALQKNDQKEETIDESINR